MSKDLSKEPLIVAIDGPSGVGKSTVARLLAKRLRAPMLDTGAMYRAVALDALENEKDPTDVALVEELVEDLDLDLRAAGDGGIEVLLRGEPVGAKIRTAEVTKAASLVSVHAAVRSKMVDLQRRFARRGGAVLEGRDIGTVVFPTTPFKFYLDARAEVRAERRHRELVAAGRGTSVELVLQDLLERDGRDKERKNSPLSVDSSYFQIDTSDLLPAEIVERMVGAIRRLREEKGETESAKKASADEGGGTNGDEGESSSAVTAKSESADPAAEAESTADEPGSVGEMKAETGSDG